MEGHNQHTMERKYYRNDQKQTIEQIITGILSEQYDNMTPFAKEMYQRHGVDPKRTSDIEKYELYKHGVPDSYRITDIPQVYTKGACLCVCFYDVEGVEDKEEFLNGNRSNLAWIQFARQGTFMNLIRQINWNSIIL